MPVVTELKCKILDKDVPNWSLKEKKGLTSDTFSHLKESFSFQRFHLFILWHIERLWMAINFIFGEWLCLNVSVLQMIWYICYKMFWFFHILPRSFFLCSMYWNKNYLQKSLFNLSLILQDYNLISSMSHIDLLLH